jgi:hypothetical protein
VPVAGDAERTMQDAHGGGSPGAPKGERNGAYRHGRFTNEAVERRRELNAWIRVIGKMAEEIA